MRAALVLICVLTLVACSRKSRQSAPEPEALADAADSASIAVWNPEEAKGDTLHHSAFYDSVLAYVRQSIAIERAKREYAAAVSSLTPLTAAHLESNKYRRMAIDSLSHYDDHSAIWTASLDSLIARYQIYIRRTLDTLYQDTARYARVLPDLLRRDLFYPRWRPEYDSVESSITQRTLDVLHLIDSNAREITFEEDLRFEDPDVASQYDSLRILLDSLGYQEQKLARADK
jgi:hypothetical protein